ncbi:ABC transporter, ATP-binding protein [Aedoeadaptatus coxii]|uniref:ABC transporter, ATP-binding protein n=1 Tax=Aedoeadaptatus coxii TaxID=755172 RepID=A0A134AIG0_9FIRM|nr:ABC transporter ATP-binding protein [Peptoniphilus coxii]KXB67320.1 ABC transporter, ATP-binding protein [Peptoniphilus coxii]CAC9933941.1 ABC transporter, ATP-binding protein [Peptoniphilus coxii]
MAFVEFIESTKTYGSGAAKTVANDRISFTIEEGEFVAIVGPSGAGKSTILNILGGMDTNDSGKVMVDGKDIAAMTEKELTTYRRNDVGFVFQFYNLIPNLTALENVELANAIVDDAMDAEEVLDQVGLGERKNHFPSQLSGGEQQRVAIARALGKNPKLLLCDEPTGALDFKTGKRVLKLLETSARKHDQTLIVITHNRAIAEAADRVIEINDAKVRDIYVNEHPKTIDEIEW